VGKNGIILRDWKNELFSSLNLDRYKHPNNPNKFNVLFGYFKVKKEAECYKLIRVKKGRKNALTVKAKPKCGG
jgi:hypothetical protein